MWGQFLLRPSVCTCNHFWLGESHIGTSGILSPLVIPYMT